MKDVKIFVSNRTDMESRAIDNEIFVPIRCGAALDDREGVEILGDDTGDNISRKKKLYSELTVMYWIWKNVKADYVGLAHYRRFLSFSSKNMPDMGMKIGYLSHMTDKNLSKLKLTDEEYLTRSILEADWFSARSYDIRTDTIVNDEKDVWHFWQKFHPEYISEEAFSLLLDTIKELYPQYYDESIKLAKGTRFLGFNCCVGKKELFDDLCSFMFDVLFSMEKKLEGKMENYSEQSHRVLGYMGEWLYTVWNFHLRKTKKYKVKERQLVMFGNTAMQKRIFPKVNHYPVVMLANAANMPYLAVSIMSVAKNTNCKVEFTLVWTEIEMSFNDKKAFSVLKKSVEEASAKANVLLVQPIEQLGLDIGAVENEAVRGFIFSIMPWLLPNHDRVLCLSECMLAKGDIAPMFCEDLHGRSIGAVRDVFFLGNELRSPHEHRDRKYRFMHNLRNFVEIDVLLMDLARLRGKYNFDEIVSLGYLQRGYGVRNFNKLYEKEIFLLGFEWNYFGVQDEAFNVMMLERIPREIKTEYKKVTDANFVYYPITWLGVDYTSSFWMEYWQMARKSPFYEFIIQQKVHIRHEGNNELNGFDADPRFLFPWNKIEPCSRIVLYGGGIVGKTFLKQLEGYAYCQIVAVCDRNPEGTGILDAPVISIEKLRKINSRGYDQILIALEREDIANIVRHDLIKEGIPANKIKWFDPHRK